MIRRDYMLRAIEEFARALARITALRKSRRWDDAAEAIDAEFQRLVGEEHQAILQLSEVELLARVIRDEPTQAVRDKTLRLTAVLYEAGELALASGGIEESRQHYLKALHLLLGVIAHGDAGEYPEFVPKVEVLLQGLANVALPLRTHAMLMQHYEQTGQFAKGEDALFAMLEAEPEHRSIAEFGLTFYQGLLRQSDAALVAGNLSRAEVQAAIKELEGRLKDGTSPDST